MDTPAPGGANPWSTHRQRALALVARYPFAAEVLGLYLALLDTWPDVHSGVHAQRPAPRSLPGWALRHALPLVVTATRAAGPVVLSSAADDLVDPGGRLTDTDGLEKSFVAWLGGADLSPVEGYFARACLYPCLVALGEAAGEACADDPSPRGGRRCPRCGGPPQLSYRAPAEDRLVSGGRWLACARCAHTWTYSASTCASCGETAGAHRTIYAEHREGPVVGRDDRDAEESGAPVFGHVRIETCTGCGRYLLDIDLGRDPAAVPEVDELAAIPLALYAADQSLTKITSNLMGF